MEETKENVEIRILKMENKLNEAIIKAQEKVISILELEY